MVETMKYKFGSNHLWIGTALEEVLEFLEERYDIDFNTLEDMRLKNQMRKEMNNKPLSM